MKDLDQAKQLIKTYESMEEDDLRIELLRMNSKSDQQFNGEIGSKKILYCVWNDLEQLMNSQYKQGWYVTSGSMPCWILKSRSVVKIDMTYRPGAHLPKPEPAMSK